MLLLTAGAGAAADFVPLRGEQAMPFKFDAENGYFQQQVVDATCPANALRTRVHFIRLGKPGSGWRPRATIMLKFGGSFAAFYLSAKTFEPPLGAHIGTYTNEKQTSGADFTATFGMDDHVPVLVAWTRKGDVSVTVGDETRTMHMKVPVDSVFLSGSAGAGEFDPVEIGRIGGESGTNACP